MLYSTATYTEPVKLLYVLQWFFSDSLGGIKVLYSAATYTEPVKLLYGSSVVLMVLHNTILQRCCTAPKVVPL